MLGLRLRIDFHVHSVYSDGVGSVRDIIKIAELRGLDGLAITDHGTLDGYFEAKSYGGRRLIILPGYEVSTDAGHVLVVGLERLPPSIGLERLVSYESLIEWVKSNGGLSILAHPAVGRLRLDRWVSCKPDAVEVLNASYPFYHILVSRGLSVSSRLGVASVGGSDAHNPINVGDAYTVVEATNNPNEEGIVEAVKEGRASYGGKLSPLNIRLKMGAAYMLSDIKYYTRFLNA